MTKNRFIYQLYIYSTISPERIQAANIFCERWVETTNAGVRGGCRDSQVQLHRLEKEDQWRKVSPEPRAAQIWRLSVSTCVGYWSEWTRMFKDTESIERKEGWEEWGDGEWGREDSLQRIIRALRQTSRTRLLLCWHMKTWRHSHRNMWRSVWRQKPARHYLFLLFIGFNCDYSAVETRSSKNLKVNAIFYVFLMRVMQNFPFFFHNSGHVHLFRPLRCRTHVHSQPVMKSLKQIWSESVEY